ncbi:hypothetical protein VKT23_008550 [Stygiomarasmius scandens]|uniref:Uncharacterized protein n=1 Tax=Marasmiellus scandens TaxID=2682957 RepID=A0ABR1JJJ4_9AGAR
MPGFAFAADLGKIRNTSSPIVWGLGAVRDPVVKYAFNNSVQYRRPYFYSDPQFSSGRIEDVINFFMQDYDGAVERAESLDLRILQDTASVSAGNEEEYFSLVSMGARLALSGFDITYAAAPGEGGIDIKAFMKNTGINDNGQTNDAVAMYASLPAFIYLNYTWMGYLLDASLDYENSLPPQDKFAALPDMGAYPQVTEANPGPGSVEDTGYMLIVAAAHAKASGDKRYIQKYVG